MKFIKRIIAVSLMVLMSNFLANLVLASVDGPSVFWKFSLWGKRRALLFPHKLNFQKTLGPSTLARTRLAKKLDINTIKETAIILLINFINFPLNNIIYYI